MSDAYAPFRHPGFRAFMVGRVLAVLGAQMISVAVGWQLYAATGDALDLGLVGLVQFLPGLFLFPLTGTVVDRVRRDRVIQLCFLTYAVSALVLVFASVAETPSRPLIFGALVLSACARAFSAPASSAILPQLVPMEDFSRAASWSSSAFQACVISGPGAGGLVYGFVERGGGNGALWVYSLAGLCFVASLAGALALPPKRASHGGKPPGLAEALDGVRYIARRPIVLGAITLDLFAVLFGGAVALLPIFAKDLLQVGPEGLGALRAAPAIGSLGMAVWLAHRPLERNVGKILYAAVAVFGLSTLVFGLSRDFTLSLVALALTGASDEISVFVRQNVVTRATPHEIRGRVSAAEFVFIGASNELGAFESGLTASWWGPVGAVVAGGVGTLATVLFSAALSKQLREVDRLEDVTPEAT